MQDSGRPSRVVPFLALALVAAVHLLAATNLVRFMMSPTPGIVARPSVGRCPVYPTTREAADLRARHHQDLLRVASVNGQVVDERLPGREQAAIVNRHLKLDVGKHNTFFLVNQAGEERQLTLEVAPSPDLRTILTTTFPGPLYHLLSLIYALGGALVWWRRPEDPGAKPLLLVGAVAGIQMAYAIPEGLLGEVQLVVRQLALPLYGPAVLFLAARFGDPRRERPLLRVALGYLVAAIVVGVTMVALTEFAMLRVPGELWLYRIGYSLIGLVLVSSTVVTVLNAHHSARPSLPLGIRRRSRVLALASTVAFVVPSLDLLLRPLLNPGPAVSRMLELGDVVLLGTFPLIMGYAIVRHRVIDLRVVARQGAVYGALSLVLSLAYVAIILVAVRVLGPAARSETFIGLALAALLILASLLKLQIQRVVDRMLFRSRTLYARTLADASARLARARTLESAAETVEAALVHGMGLSRAYLGVLERDGERLRVIALADHPDAPVDEAPPTLVGPLVTARIAPVRRALSSRRLVKSYDSAAAQAQLSPDASADTTPPSVLAHDLPCDERPTTGAAGSEARFWAYHGLEAIVPLSVGDGETGATVGLLFMGPKVNEQPLTADDEQLLETLANQLAVAIENSRAFAEIQRLKDGLEDDVKARTAELETALTDLQATQGRLLEAEKQAMLGRLVAGIVHELNSPLGAMRSAADTAARSLPPLESALGGNGDQARARRAAKALQQVTRVFGEGTARLSEVLESLERFVALDAAKEQKVDVRSGLDAALVMISGSLKGGVRIERRYRSNGGRVLCRPERLNQLFLNLIQNSLDAVSGDGTIVIATEEDARAICVRVEDDGCGIDPDRLTRIFDFEFTRKKTRVGLGLGLPMSKRFVEELGGSISIDSAPGAGTRVAVELPTVS